MIQPLGARLGRLCGDQFDARRVDDGSNSFGTVFVAGRNRVPRPAAGTIAVRGIGTKARVVIVHTITASTAHNRASPAIPRDIVYPVPPTKAELRAAIVARRRALAADVRQRRGRALVRPSDRPGRTGRHRLRVRARRLRARVARDARRAGRVGRARVAAGRARGRRRPPAAAVVGGVPARRTRCGAVRTARATGAVADRRGDRGRRRRSWFLRWPSTGQASGSAGARASTTARWPGGRRCAADRDGARRRTARPASRRNRTTCR